MECIDCRVAIQPGPPPAREGGFGGLEVTPDVKLVSIRTFSGPTARLEAALAKNLLQTQGILCILPGEIAADALPVFDIPLLVREQDASQAAEILKSYLDSPASPGDDLGPMPAE